MSMQANRRSLFDAQIVRRASFDALSKLSPRTMMRNPVMFVVEIGSVLTTVLLIANAVMHRGHFSFNLQITLVALVYVLFANFAEAMAEGRGKAQADALRRAKSETTAYRVVKGAVQEVPSSQLRAGDVVKVAAGQMIPGDGEVIEGVASVDESAITGESAPVIREAGGDRSAVTGGTRVLSDIITVRITSNPGETFLDRMIALVEGAERQKTPNEIALNILLAGLTIIFLLRGCHTAAVRCVLWRAANGIRAHLIARVPYSDNDRRPVICDRYCRHGSSGAAQRACYFRPRSGSCGRCEHIASGQDRDDYNRQPAGFGVHCRSRRRRRAARRRSAALVALGRDT